MIIYSDKQLSIPNGINPNYGAYTPTGELQQKTVNSSTSEQTVLPDSGYVGMYKVTVNPYTLDSSSLVVSRNGEYTVRSAADGLSKVDVSVNIDVQSYYEDGYKAGEVAGIAEQKAKLDSSTFTDNGTYTRADGWNEVTVNVDTSTYYDEGYAAGETAGIAEGIAEQKAKLDSSTFTSNGTFTRADGWNQVTIDVTEAHNQDKTVDSSTASQSISADSGYTGLGTVTVNPYVLDSSSLVVTENGEYTVTSEEDGLSRVDVSVNIDTSSYYQSGYSAGETAGIAEGIAEQKAKLDSSTFRNVGTFTREDGWNSITVDVNTVNNQNKTVDSSYNSQTVTFDSGYTGLGTVTINPYSAQTKAVDGSSLIERVSGDTSIGSNSSITPDIGYGSLREVDFKKLAVCERIDLPFAGFQASSMWEAPGFYYDQYTGTYVVDTSAGVIGARTINAAGAIRQSEVLNSSTAIQRVYADVEHGKAIDQVTVNPYTVQSKSVDASTASQTITPDASYDALSSVSISAVTSNIDSNIVAPNIKQGVTILGVTGTYEGSGGDTDIDIYESITLPANGLCVFDTGILFDTTDSYVEFDGIWYTGGGWTMGTDNTVSGNLAFTCSDVNMPNPWYICWAAGGTGGTDPNDSTIYDTNEHVWKLGNRFIIRDNVTLWSDTELDLYPTQAFAIGATKDNGEGFSNFPSAAFFFKYIDIYKNGTRIRNFRPAKDASDNIYLFDTITHSTIDLIQYGSPAPTLGAYSYSDKRWSTLWVTPGAVPQQYIAGIDTDTVIGVVNVEATACETSIVRAEYISNEYDRNVYIDTGITPDTNTVIEITMSMPDGFVDGWCGWTGIVNHPYHFALFQNNGDKCVHGLYQQTDSGDAWLTGDPVVKDKIATYRFGVYDDGNDCTYTFQYSDYSQGVPLTSSATGYPCQWDSDHHIYIFGVQNGTNYGLAWYAPGAMRVYRYRIIQGEFPVCDAIPVFDNTTGQYELYDRTAGRFLERHGAFSGNIGTPRLEFEDYVLNSTYSGHSSIIKSEDGYAATNSNFEFSIKFSDPVYLHINQDVFPLAAIGYNSSTDFKYIIGYQGTSLKMWYNNSGTPAQLKDFSSILPSGGGPYVLTIRSQYDYSSQEQRLYFYINNQSVGYVSDTSIPGIINGDSESAYNGYYTVIYGDSDLASNMTSCTKVSLKVYWYEIVDGDGVLHRYIPWQNSHNAQDFGFYDKAYAQLCTSINNNALAKGMIYLR